MERIDGNTWRTDNGDEVRARGLRLTVEFGERTKAEVLCAVEAVKAENAKLREQIERLVTLLRVDCDIDASWDGLRRFWSIGLTEGGCLMRDRACKAEAENAELRHDLEEANNQAEEVCIENSKLRELVDAWMGCGTRYHTMQGGCPMFDADAENFCKAARIARELGVEVDA